MAQLGFYGGVNEIGGNKILLEEAGTTISLDFGLSFATRSRYFEEYLKPRSTAGLLDLLEMDLLPPWLEIYRQDLLTPEIKDRFKESSRQFNPFGLEPSGRSLEAVFLSHAHLDHSGYISFLRSDIPVYTTLMTALISKAMQDSSPDDFEKEVVYCIPREKRGKAIVSTDYRKQPAQQRCFRILDEQNLSTQVADFWQNTPGARQLEKHPLVYCSLGRLPDVGQPTLSLCPFKFKYFPVDHSIFGAAAFALETESGWLVYTGDLRLRGKRGKQTREFIERASQLKPTVLLCEGTNVGANSPTASEEEIYSRALTAVKQARGLVIADFGPRNVERLTTFHQIAQETSRQLVILSKDAYLLEAMRLASSEIPNLAQDNFISIYEDTKAQLSGWEKKVRTKYQNKLLTPREISQHQPDYILCFSFFDINKLSSILPKEGSLYLYSSSEVYDEEGALDMERLHNWLDHFGIDRLGLPRKEEIGWEVPQDERGLHASGHASEAELIELIKDLSPKMLIPIHTQKPDYFIELLRDTDIKVHLPKYRERLNF